MESRENNTEENDVDGGTLRGGGYNVSAWKAIVFGATASANMIYEEIRKKYEIVAFADNDKGKVGGDMGGIPIIKPLDIKKLFWDEIIIVSYSAMYTIKRQLLDMGISEYKINTRYVEMNVEPRKRFCEDFATLANRYKLSGCTAEAGVFQGEYAAVINKSFPDRKLYLFDTFEGFDQRDIDLEQKNGFSDARTGHLNTTSESFVLDRMPYPQNCMIKKGYFPETAKGISERFCYVNLDLDLYKPTLEGLRFFYPLMVQGGIITVHDYFPSGYRGIREAVKEFLNEEADSIVPFPIGDHVSIAIQKNFTDSLFD